MVLTDAFFRTFFVKAADYGTAFVLTVDGSQYLVTAKHLFDETEAPAAISVFIANQWKNLALQFIGLGRGEVDVAVFACPKELESSEFKLTPTQGEFTMGQEVHFLGFPYKLWGDVGAFLDGMPCAFVKGGTLSFFDFHGNKALYVDAINNEGFSGGPLVFSPPSRPTEMLVAGVVSKFRVEREPVLDESGQKTGMHVPYNTGLLVAYGMAHVIGIVRRQGSA